MSSNFRYQPFVVVSGYLAGKVLLVDDVSSSHGHEIYPTTSLDENCIEFHFQTDGNYHLDLRQAYLALKVQFVKGSGDETHKSKKVKKEAQRKAQWGCRKGGGVRGSSSSRYSCKQHFALNVFQC